MKVLVLLLALACTFLFVESQNVVCGKGTTSKTVTLEKGKSYNYKTQQGKKYAGNTKCTVNYKLGDTCAKMTFVCTKFNTNNADKRRCRRGDKLTVTATGGKPKVYCKTKKPKVTSSGDLKVLFTSDKKRSSTGATCKVRCTVAKETGGGGGGSTSDCKCGLAVRSKRIVGGKTTEVSEYPWQVGIVDKGDKYIWCGGTLINNRWILTAAHCTRGSKASGIQALLGEHDTKTTSETKMVRMAISLIKDHSKYHHATTNYDFSLLKMKKSIDFSKYPHIRPICLPLDNSNDYTDQIATVTGWGTLSSGGSSPTKLREVNVNVLSNTECKNDYNYPPSWITDQMLCANVDGGGKDACQGDSGGPLVSAVGGDGVTPGQNYELIGVVSWGSGCAKATYPGVYSRVTKQLNWIANIATGGTTCPRT